MQAHSDLPTAFSTVSGDNSVSRPALLLAWLRLVSTALRHGFRLLWPDQALPAAAHVRSRGLYAHLLVLNALALFGSFWLRNPHATPLQLFAAATAAALFLYTSGKVIYLASQHNGLGREEAGVLRGAFLLLLLAATSGETLLASIGMPLAPVLTMLAFFRVSGIGRDLLTSARKRNPRNRP